MNPSRTAALAALLVPQFAFAALAPADVAVAREGGEALVVRARFAAPRLAPLGGGVAVTVPGLGQTVEAGMPAVPVRTLAVALPPGTRLAGVEVSGPVSTLRAMNVTRNRSMVPYSWRDLDHTGVPVTTAPELPAQYPRERATASVQVLHGVALAIVNVYPVVVDTKRGSLSVASEVSVRLRCAPDPAMQRGRALTGRERAQLAALVANPQELPAASALAGGYDYLILTTAALMAPEGRLPDLVADLARRGLVARVVDVATIAAAGKDVPEKIRNFIRGEYQSSGIRYVLLAADGDTGWTSSGPIPARRLWSKIRSYNGTWHMLECKIPADLYYSNLDADFDGNGNGIWGEPADGANGGDVDLLSEVVVGRIPVDTAAELASVVAKTLEFARADQPRNVLLMGEELFAQMDLYGDEYMDQLVGACTDHAYQTQGYSPAWTAKRLYDRQGAWNSTTALATINAGDFTYVHHLGHSNQTYNMRMSSSRIKKFTNPRPFFYYTQGCFPGDFTSNDCFVEGLIRHDKGAAAAIANTCYGLGPEDPQPETTKTPGASQMLHRRFVDAALAGAESIGRANQDSKEAFIGLAASQEVRWVFWDAHVFGDPSLPPPR